MEKDFSHHFQRYCFFLLDTQQYVNIIDALILILEYQLHIEPLHILRYINAPQYQW